MNDERAARMDPGTAGPDAGDDETCTGAEEPRADTRRDATRPGPTTGEGPDHLMTMAEYKEAMEPRAQLARARGLSAPYIPGGRDPTPEEGRREERHYLRLLVGMVAIIVLGGFALSIIGLVIFGGGFQ